MFEMGSNVTNSKPIFLFLYSKLLGRSSQMCHSTHLSSSQVSCVASCEVCRMLPNEHVNLDSLVGGECCDNDKVSDFFKRSGPTPMWNPQEHIRL